MARKKRSDKELAAAAARLHAEVRRFTLLVNALIAPPQPLAPVARDAVREAFLDHARSLTHFLHPVRPRAEDMLAADFFPQPGTWNRLRLRPSARLKSLRADGGGRLTYNAPAASEPPDARTVVEIANEISAGVSIFLRHAPRRALGPSWHDVRPGEE